MPLLFHYFMIHNAICNYNVMCNMKGMSSHAERNYVIYHENNKTCLF